MQKTEENSSKMIDWKNTQIYQNCVYDRVKEFNYTGDQKYFTEKEIDYVLEMIRDRGIPEKKLVKPFYFKASLTLYKLVEYCELDGTKYYSQIMDLYKDVNIENILKMLIRSKQL